MGGVAVGNRIGEDLAGAAPGPTRSSPRCVAIKSGNANALSAFEVRPGARCSSAIRDGRALYSGPSSTPPRDGESLTPTARTPD